MRQRLRSGHSLREVGLDEYDDRGVPLRVVETDSKGHETARTTATRLNVHPVDASLFAIPHEYRNLARN